MGRRGGGGYREGGFDGNVVDIITNSEGFTLDDDFNERVIVPMKEVQPKEEDFRTLFQETRNGEYSQGQINSDVKEVIDLKNLPDYSRRKPDTAIALEYETAYGISRLNMFGEEADAVSSSEYDDHFMYCDVLVTFLGECDNEDEDDVYLSIDAKTGDINETRDVVTKTLKKLEKGGPNTIKYAVDNSGKPIGRINLPKTVFHLDPNKVAFFQEIMGKDKKEFSERDRKELTELQANLVWQTKLQLRESIRFILAERIATDSDQTDEDLIAFIEQERKGQIDRYLRKGSKENLDVYYLVYKKLVEFAAKKELPDVEELNTVMTKRLIQDVAASFGRQAYQEPEVA